MTDEEKALDIQPGDEITFDLGGNITHGVAIGPGDPGFLQVESIPEKIPLLVKYSKIAERHRVIEGTGTSSRYYDFEEEEEPGEEEQEQPPESDASYYSPPYNELGEESE